MTAGTATDDLDELARLAGEHLRRAGKMLVTAESCTGGWVAKCVTDVAGSSQWFERGFVTYSNAAKREQLDVAADTLEHAGAVSEAAVAEMARGALRHSHAHIAVAISGIAGPGGEVPGKPVGTVCFAWCGNDGTQRVETRHFTGDREAIRHQAVRHALQGIVDGAGA